MPLGDCRWWGGGMWKQTGAQEQERRMRAFWCLPTIYTHGTPAPWAPPRSLPRFLHLGPLSLPPLLLWVSFPSSSPSGCLDMLSSWQSSPALSLACPQPAFPFPLLPPALCPCRQGSVGANPTATIFLTPGLLHAQVLPQMGYGAFPGSSGTGWGQCVCTSKRKDFQDCLKTMQEHGGREMGRAWLWGPQPRVWSSPRAVSLGKPASPHRGSTPQDCRSRPMKPNFETTGNTSVGWKDEPQLCSDALKPVSGTRAPLALASCVRFPLPPSATEAT